MPVACQYTHVLAIPRRTVRDVSRKELCYVSVSAHYGGRACRLHLSARMWTSTCESVACHVHT